MPDFFTLNVPNSNSAGFRPDPAGKVTLTVLSRPPSWIWGKEREKRKEGRGKRGKMREEG